MPSWRSPFVVLVDRHTQRGGGGLEESPGSLLRKLVTGDANWTACSAVGVLATLVVLHALVRRVDRIGVPALVALGGPGVEVGAVATHVDHAVDRARAADDLAARGRHLAVEEVLLRGRVEAPVDGLLELRHGVHRADHAGLLDQELLVALARFEQDDGVTGLGEPPGDRTTGASRSDDDVVGLARPLSCHGFSPFIRSRVSGPSDSRPCRTAIVRRERSARSPSAPCSERRDGRTPPRGLHR